MAATTCAEMQHLSLSHIPRVKGSHMAQANISGVEKCLTHGKYPRARNRVGVCTLLARLAVAPKLSGIKQQFVISPSSVG